MTKKASIESLQKEYQTGSYQMNSLAQESSHKALFEFYEQIVGEITKFETFLASLDKHPLVKALAEEDPRSKDSSGKARTISKIALDDALNAYENILVEISKEIPSFTVEQAPIEFYQAFACKAR